MCRHRPRQWPRRRGLHDDAPFALYVPTSFPDRTGELWWLTLEAVIARQIRVALVMNGEDRRYDCDSVEAKYELYEHIYWWLRSLEHEDDLRTAVRDLASRYGVDPAAFCRELCMTWQEIGELASVAEESSPSAEQVSAATEQTSASTEQIAASAQELAATAEELARLVGQFKVA